MSKIEPLASYNSPLLAQVRQAHVSAEIDEVPRAHSTHSMQCVSPFEPARVAGRPNRGELRSGARYIQRMRQSRGVHLPSEMFGEISWEIMLSLYVEEDNQSLSLTAISMLVQVPMTTLIRWITFLELKLLVETVSVSTDSRVRLLRMTDHGRDVMDDYMAEILRT